MSHEKRLGPHDHSRDAAGLRYVYPVVSRRAGGLSIGINLNPNNACNWRCIYCQVPNLQRGKAPVIDLAVLESELEGFLDNVLRGDFYQRFEVEPDYRKLQDIAISGNGEPTSAEEFPAVIERIGRVMNDYELRGRLKLVLISNGSLIHQQRVQQGLRRLDALGGELWFKVDSATDAGLQRINQAATRASRARRNLEIGASLCSTWLQTCVFRFRGEHWAESEAEAYIDLVSALSEQPNHFKGVLLYGLARPSMQLERESLDAVDAQWLQALVASLRRMPIEVRMNP